MEAVLFVDRGCVDLFAYAVKKGVARLRVWCHDDPLWGQGRLWAVVDSTCAPMLVKDANAVVRLVPRRSAVRAGSFVDRGKIVDLYADAIEVGRY